MKGHWLVAITAALVAVAITSAGSSAAPKGAAGVGAASKERAHVKFKEGTSIRLRGNQLVSLGGTDLTELRAVIRRHPGLRIQRLFSRAENELAEEKARNEKRSGRKLPDKNLWYRFTVRPGDDLAGLVRELKAVDIVQTAYAEPLPAPPPVTPSFVDDQGYLNAATDGIDAEYAWTIPGGTGGNVRIVDIEYSWNQNHEDLDSASGAGVLIPNGTPSDPFSSNNHGTAVLGELIATNDAIGVTGIAHNAAVGLVNANNTEDGYDLADSIDTAAAALTAGDVILIEQQTAGANGGCNSTTQNGCVAVEWVQAFYDSIVNATAAGIVVVEAAGNGNEDLGDTGDYGNPFPDGRADSGAIIVGAGGTPDCTNPARGRLSFSTFGPRVNLQGWGECVVTTGYGGLQGGPMNEWYTSTFNGTSSASPIVTGAAAVLSSVAQQQGVAYSPGQIRSRLVATGTAQVTASPALAGNIGPLPNLREALKAFVPDSNPGGPYTTQEGTDVTLNGGASTDPQGGSLTYAWDFDNDGFDDGSTQSVTFDRVGQDGTFTVRLRVTDSAGASDIDSATVTVTNVAPTTTVAPIAGANENVAISVQAVVSDPGWLETLTATVDWGDGAGPQAVSGTLENTRPNATLTLGLQHTYGDDGTFTVTVCGADDDTSANCASRQVTIANVAPTATIDESGTILVNGVPTFVAKEGVPVPFSGRATDPGSDDLTLTWSWGDGPPAPDVSTLYLNNGAFNPDPDPSPTINPRDVTDNQPHAFSDACFYTVVFDALDDDGGNALDDTVKVIIAGNASSERGAGYWQTQYRPRPTAFTEARRQCYLDIAGFMSAVFDEVRNASTVAQAFDVLAVNQNAGQASQQLDRQLLTAWLNFANGAFDLSELVDANGDGTPDTAFSAVMATAESVRLNPAATDAQLYAQRDILQRINGS
jgi:serine protease